MRSVVVAPEFAPLGITERVNLVYDYLRGHLSQEDYGQVSLALAVSPEEYEHGDWRPSEAVPMLSAA